MAVFTCNLYIIIYVYACEYIHIYIYTYYFKSISSLFHLFFRIISLCLKDLFDIWCMNYRNDMQWRDISNTYIMGLTKQSIYGWYTAYYGIRAGVQQIIFASLFIRRWWSSATGITPALWFGPFATRPLAGQCLICLLEFALRSHWFLLGIWMGHAQTQQSGDSVTLSMHGGMQRD
jgi:hypothetical protein